jgi:hypothetical protein
MTADDSARPRVAEWIETDIIDPIDDFQNPKQEWRRLFSELLGTFFLVLVAAGGGMMGQAFPDTISRTVCSGSVMFSRLFMIRPLCMDTHEVCVYFNSRESLCSSNQHDGKSAGYFASTPQRVPRRDPNSL